MSSAENKANPVADELYVNEAVDDIILDDLDGEGSQGGDSNEYKAAVEDSLTEDGVGGAERPEAEEEEIDPTRVCGHCGKAMGRQKGAATKKGPIHIGCVLEYKFLHQPRCGYCDIRFLDSEATSFVKDEATGRLYHPECRHQELKKVPYVRPTWEGAVRKYSIARSKLSMHNWKKRYFILSPLYNGIRYFVRNPSEAANSGSASAAGDGEESGSSGGDEGFDTDADPKLVEEHAKKAKGMVPLERNRARLLTHPAASIYKISSSAASATNDIAIIFFDSPESTTERRLLFQCKDKEEKQGWVRALEGYIHTVDDPRDYGAGASDEKDKRGKK